jgi:hypothetical protein
LQNENKKVLQNINLVLFQFIFLFIKKIDCLFNLSNKYTYTMSILYEHLTNDFIMNIDENVFMKTLAFNTFGNKITFINNITDKAIRFQMLQNILQNTNPLSEPEPQESIFQKPGVGWYMPTSPQTNHPNKEICIGKIRPRFDPFGPIPGPDNGEPNADHLKPPGW